MIEEIAKIYGIETSKYGVHTIKKESQLPRPKEDEA